MRIRHSLLVPALLAIAIPWGAGAASAQAPSNQEAETRYIVRPGDTLEGIARRLFGSASRWEEIWRLNPAVTDPYRLTPGERLRLPARQAQGSGSAHVRTLSRQVEEKPQPIAWLDAEIGDLLQERDGIRTLANSSAELVLADGARIVLSEDSLLFLRPKERPAPARAGAIEIVAGQADYERRAAAAAGNAGGAGDEGIEIVIGGARAEPVADAAGNSRARARRPAAGGAQVMVYDGSSTVEAAGETVALPVGTGTSVPEAGPPAPAEPLLPAPGLVSPRAGESLAFANPGMLWDEVEGAVAYTFEVCFDPDCTALFARQENLAGRTAFQMPMIPIGTYHWRVTAVSPSGLDGYPSATREVAITSDRLDAEAPELGLEIEGPAATVAGRLFLGPRSALRAPASDDLAGVALQAYLLDGTDVPGDQWTGGWLPGPHRVRSGVVDGAGYTRLGEELEFTLDAAAPEISWHRATRSELAGWTSRIRRPSRSAERRAALFWSATGERWVPLVPRDRRDWMAAEPWTIASRHPRLVVRAGRKPVVLTAGPGPVAEDDFVIVEARDAGSGVLALRFGAGERPGELVFEAEDLVGNVSRTVWTIE